jgi:hypothetical protein
VERGNVIDDVRDFYRAVEFWNAKGKDATVVSENQ